MFGVWALGFRESMASDVHRAHARDAGCALRLGESMSGKLYLGDEVSPKTVYDSYTLI